MGFIPTTRLAMPSLDDVYAQLRQVYDPEIPVNIVDLGLIYDVALDGATCKIKMTLTSQACPEARTIPDVMKRRVNSIAGHPGHARSTSSGTPPWTPHRISPEGRARPRAWTKRAKTRSEDSRGSWIGTRTSRSTRFDAAAARAGSS